MTIDWGLIDTALLGAYLIFLSPFFYLFFFAYPSLAFFPKRKPSTVSDAGFSILLKRDHAASEQFVALSWFEFVPNLKGVRHNHDAALLRSVGQAQFPG